MALYEFEGKIPVIGEGSYVFESASVIGNVIVGNGVFIGPGAVLRGDYGRIVIGNGTALEDNAVIHARPGEEIKIGENVTIGHGSVIHNCKIDDHAVIGMGAVVSDWAHVKEWAVVAEGAVVRNKMVVEGESIVAGVPAKPIAKINDSYKHQWLEFKGIYSDFARSRYPKGLKRIG